MSYMVSRAELTHLQRIEELYAGARQFMADNGNPTQWGSGYPPREQVIADIHSEKLYLISDENGIHGVFYFSICPDPTYNEIYEGKWSSNASYGVLHRIAGDGSGGILYAAVRFAKERISYLRIDTHRDNHIMQRALSNQGFQFCGTIYIEDGTERLAFDYTI